MEYALGFNVGEIVVLLPQVVAQKLSVFVIMESCGDFLAPSKGLMNDAPNSQIIWPNCKNERPQEKCWVLESK